MVIVNVFKDLMMMSGLMFWFVMLLEFIAKFVIPAVVTLIKKFVNVIYRMVTKIWNDIREYHACKRLSAYYYDFDEILYKEVEEIEASKRK